MCGISRESNYINIARKPRCYEISATWRPEHEAWIGGYVHILYKKRLNHDIWNSFVPDRAIFCVKGGWVGLHIGINLFSFSYKAFCILVCTIFSRNSKDSKPWRKSEVLNIKLHWVTVEIVLSLLLLYPICWHEFGLAACRVMMAQPALVTFTNYAHR